MLRYHPVCAFVGWSGVGLAVVLLVGSLLTLAQPVRSVCFSGAYLLVACLLIWTARRWTVTYTDAEVCYAPLFAPTFCFPWESVAAAHYSGFAREWVFPLADGRKVRVPRDFVGHRDFIETARRRTSVPVPDAYWPYERRRG